MLHTKYHFNLQCNSGEDDFQIPQNIIWAWWPSWYCDPDPGNKISTHGPQRLHMIFGFNQPSDFREDV